METRRCEIEHITYSSPESGWAVLKVRMQGYHVPVTVVGALCDASPGSTLEVEGEWRNDPRFGRQFAVGSWHEIMPSTTEGLVRYLGSGMLYGVGPHFARKIVDRFGMDTLQVLDSDIGRLLEIPNLGPKKLKKIAESWEKQKGIRTVSMFLQQHGVSSSFASRIFRLYGADTIAQVKSDPYRLADDVWGIGFKYADDIAASLGYAADDVRRVRSGILFTLARAAENDGHVYLERERLNHMASALLEVEEERVGETLADMEEHRDVRVSEDAVYLPQYYYAETGSAKRVGAMIHDKSVLDGPDVDKALRHSLDEAEANGISYDTVQIDAVRMALTHRIMVFTGGPGTGKTTATKAIIEAFSHAGKTILAAAPTGRAAKRMAEATGLEAKTIHRLLEYNPVGGYMRDEDNPLEGDVLIVDECSMIDLQLFYRLVKAIPDKMNVVFVGDIDQLPSVGAGNVLHDLIESGVVPVTRLTRIFRQAQSSRIVMSAHAINRGVSPDMSNGRDTDFFFIETADRDRISETIVDLACRRLPKAYGINPSEIQILTPMHRGNCGATNLNIMLQESLNSQGECIERRGISFRVGDKVMQIRNNYDKNVFNGDIGFVREVDRQEKTLKVRYDTATVEYEMNDLDELTLAYAVTIHKSQGCEFPVVVIPVTLAHMIMLRRNLLYTAITRARRICVLVGERNAVTTAVRNATATCRNSRLAERIKTFITNQSNAE